MIDFLLTPEGDLSLEETRLEDNRLKVNFYMSKSNALKITFDMDEGEELTPSPSALTINFNLLEIVSNKRARLAKDEEYIMQQLLIRLKTSLGELPRRLEIGSTLETIMHKNLNDKTVIADVEAIVREATSDLLDNYNIKVTPFIDKTDGYRQVMNVEVYKDNQLLLNYELEG